MREIDKCKNCGATIEADGTKKTVTCKYCGARYVLDNNELVTTQPQKNTEQQNSNQTKTQTINTNIKKIPPRPTVNILIAVICFMFYFFTGIIYLIYVRILQSKWDAKYGNLSNQNSQINNKNYK